MSGEIADEDEVVEGRDKEEFEKGENVSYLK